MTQASPAPSAASSAAALPSRLHHNAYVTRDQEATRAFYEDIVGLPLVATWKESDELFGAVRTYCHTFYGLGDGSALAFFQFADPEDQKQFGPEMPHSPFQHIALKVTEDVQNAITERLEKAGWRPDETYVLEHGYCRSLYTSDPNGLLLEFTLDAPGIETSDAERRRTARAELASWLAGEHTTNNTYR
ncbi:VOC family protein [Streptomyces sp. B21-083]|uniref:VOC family protein n=1 Tax=Streptomyces sp. B21-083 TaxID=3039410 RepID=UPI002FEF998A